MNDFEMLIVMTRRVRILVEERDAARAVARVLAHAYVVGNRPPEDAIDQACAYPTVPSE